MQRKCGIASGVIGTVVITLWSLLVGWGGLQPTSAQTIDPALHDVDAAPTNPAIRLAGISPAIPVYDGASYSPELSARALGDGGFDHGAEVWVLATDDAFPQVWHYYVSYLAQFRTWKPAPAYPPARSGWRRLELDLNEVMRDPFIPGDSLDAASESVRLEIVETGSTPSTIIRYIVMPRGAEGLVAGSRADETTRPSKR